MSMLPVDLDDLENDILETFEEIGDNSAMDVFSYTPAVGSSASIYKEEKFKTYTKLVSLTGRIKLSPKTEELSDIGRKRECTCIFTFDTKQLKNKGVITSSTTGEEVCSVTLDSVIRYKGKYYEICNICPVAMIGNRFLLYKFEGKEIDNLSNMTFMVVSSNG